MAKNSTHAHILAYVFWSFLGQLGWNFLWALRKPLSIDWWWLIQRMVLIYILKFWASFGGKMGLATTCAPNGMGPPNPTETLAHWMNLLGQPLSRNHVFEIFMDEPRPPLKSKSGNLITPDLDYIMHGQANDWQNKNTYKNQGGSQRRALAV